jgi:hypothetical protein
VRLGGIDLLHGRLHRRVPVATETHHA